MTPERPAPCAKLQREVFLAALECEAPEQRAAFLAQACAGQDELRQSVEELLREQDRVGGFMEEPALAMARTQPEPRLSEVVGSSEEPGEQIGNYRLLQKIGEGGCGAVYRAEQQSPLRRTVAVKLLKPGMDTGEVIRYFERERQTLALMEHPNIARVFDAGTTETGRPFFVMELVQGSKLTQHCDAHRLPIRERLELFIQVCLAIQHAHQKGIIHQDIKPSNILVAVHDGKPVPKVIDFGIAQAIHRPQLNHPLPFPACVNLLGTPAYMSPEQLDVAGKEVDTRSDIYSLGVLLYELVTGTTPFDGQSLVEHGLEECRRLVRDAPPEQPSARLAAFSKADLNRTSQDRRIQPRTLIELVRGDLDSMLLKALAKDPARRYASVGAFAQDLQCYLANEPVLARPAGNLYRLQKLFQRHKIIFASAGAVALALLVGTAVSLWEAVTAKRAEAEARLSQRMESQLRRQADFERERAKEQATLAGLNEYVADINLAQQALNGGNYGRAVLLLNKHLPQRAEPELRGFEWRYLWRLSRGDPHAAFPTQPHAVRSMAVSPGGDLVAIGTDRELKLWNLHSQVLLKTIPEGVLSVAFAASNSELIVSTRRGVWLYDTENWAGKELPGRTAGPSALSPDGSRMAVAARDGVQVWATGSGLLQHMLPGASAPLAFSPDGKLLVTDTPGGLTLWQMDDFSVRRLLKRSQKLFARPAWNQLGQVLAFSPDGAYLVAPRNSFSEPGGFGVGVWDVQSGEELAGLPPEPTLNAHTGFIAWLAFSPEGLLATASMDHSVRLWDLPGRRALGVLHGHPSEVWTVCFSPDGHTLLSGAKDGSVNLWAIPTKQDQDLLAGPYATLAFAKDGRTLAVLDRQRGEVVFLDPVTRESKRAFPLPESKGASPARLAFDADLQVLAQGLNDGTVRLYNGELKEVARLQAGPGPLAELALSPDGRQLVTRGFDQDMLWWDLTARTNCIVTSRARKPLFSPDGRTLLLYGGGEGAELWDAATRCLRTRLKADTELGPVAAFSPDSRLVAVASDPLVPEQSIKLWDTKEGQWLGAFIGHKQGISALAFSSDSRTLASSSHDSTLKLWNVATLQELVNLQGIEPRTWNLRFSPDGTLLTSEQAGQQQGIRFYSAPFSQESHTGTAVSAIP